MFTKWKCQYNYCPAAIENIKSKTGTRKSKVLLVEMSLQGELMERGLKTLVKKKKKRKKERNGDFMNKFWIKINKNIV